MLSDLTQHRLPNLDSSSGCPCSPTFEPGYCVQVSLALTDTGHALYSLLKQCPMHMQAYLLAVPCLLVVVVALTAAALSGWQTGWAKYTEHNFKAPLIRHPIKFEIWAGYVRGAPHPFVPSSGYACIAFLSTCQSTAT